MATIVNVKAICKKSRTHTVTERSDGSLLVTSGVSGNEYVVHFTDNGATCTCDWGHYRKANDPRSGCSHVQAAYEYVAELARTRIAAHPNLDTAKRQHRPIVNIGDGVVLTVRRVA